VWAAVEEWGDYVRQETLSVEVVHADAPGVAPAGAHVETGEMDGRSVTIAVVRV
jgi:hypothetical protein